MKVAVRFKGKMAGHLGLFRVGMAEISCQSVAADLHLMLSGQRLKFGERRWSSQWLRYGKGHGLKIVIYAAYCKTFTRLPDISPVFNGKNLSGWTLKAGNDKFYVERWLHRRRGRFRKRHEQRSLHKKDYGNFILELDFKVDHPLFSGVQIRSQYAAKDDLLEVGRAAPDHSGRGMCYGYLVLIDPSPIHRWWTATLYDQRWWTGGIYDELRRHVALSRFLGGDPDDFSRQGMKIFRTNDWNHLRIEAVGDSIRNLSQRRPLRAYPRFDDVEGFHRAAGPRLDQR